MQTVRLLIISDDHLTRAGLASLLSAHADFDVVAQLSVADFWEDWEEDESEWFDVVIWDVGWQEAQRPFSHDAFPYPVIALLPEGDRESIEWQEGWHAMLSRQAPVEQIATAVYASLENLHTFDPQLFVPETAVASPISMNSADPTLTPREQDVLQLLAEGLTNKAIGQKLAISNHTVKFHINAIMTKLEAQSRTEAVVRATRLGLLSL